MRFSNPRTKRFRIETLSNEGKSRTEAYQELRPLVLSQVHPMIFKMNAPGGRVPKEMHEQLIDLKHEINRVYAILGNRGRKLDTSTADIEPEPIQDDPEIQDELEDVTADEIPAEDEPEDEPEINPVAKGKKRIKDELERFLVRVREIREFCENRSRLSESLDHISMRPAQAAARLIPAGIPCDALLYNMTMHWSEDSRREAGISEFDFLSLAASIARERNLPAMQNGKELHKLFPYVLTLAECRQNVMLIGPAGTGKSRLVRQIADYLNLPYSEAPLSPGAMRGDFLGRHTAGGYIPAKFPELYSGGGVFNFEEIDSADPGMLILLNNALASDTLYNSMSGTEHVKSEDFIAFSTANTFGLGANRDYTARERLDAATIDRWRMSRVFVELDQSVEESILHGS